MKKIILIVLLLTQTSLFSQEKRNSIWFGTSLNTYDHSSLKEFQQEFVGDLNEVELRTVDEFPSNLSYQLGYKHHGLNLSIILQYDSTGGKLSYSDFSSNIRITELLNAYTLGVQYDYYLLKPINGSSLFIGLKGLVSYSTLEIESLTQILDINDADVFNFNSTTIGAGANLNYEFSFASFSIRPSLGYDFLLPGDIWLDTNKEAYLVNDNDERVKTNWSGLRIGTSFSFNF